jgi:hypothetical protein
VGIEGAVEGYEFLLTFAFVGDYYKAALNVIASEATQSQLSANFKWNAGYERIGKCVKHADAGRARKPRKRPSPKKPRPKRNKQ